MMATYRQIHTKLRFILDTKGVFGEDFPGTCPRAEEEGDSAVWRIQDATSRFGGVDGMEG